MHLHTPISGEPFARANRFLVGTLDRDHQGEQCTKRHNLAIHRRICNRAAMDGCCPSSRYLNPPSLKTFIGSEGDWVISFALHHAYILPTGRTLRDCQSVFQNLRGSSTTTASNGPASFSDPYKPTQSRSYSMSESYMPQSIQPRPSHPSSTTYTTQGPPALDAQPARKSKRGRPTNAEVETRRQEAAARGETYPPVKSAKRSKPSSMPGMCHDARLEREETSISPTHNMCVAARHSSESSAGALSQERSYRSYEEQQSPSSYVVAMPGPPTPMFQDHRMLPPLSAMMSDTARRPLDAPAEHRTNVHHAGRRELLNH